MEPIVLPKAKMKTLLADAAKAAAAVHLVYVSGTEPGIKRVKRGKNFSYVLGDKPVKAREELERIKKLVIPPAWEDVWICALGNGHLQATGFDVLKRKQYRYHPHWAEVRGQAKFYHIYEFGKALPAIRKQVEKDLSLPGMPAEKVLAAVVSLMEQTSIRVGNSMYEKLYGSFGLTTLKDKHVSFKNGSMAFCFKGKKGVEHSISLKSSKLLKIVKQCRDIPGKELFQYYNEAGECKAIDSGMVNNYIKQVTGGDFTAKDFRTWAGTVHALRALKEMGEAETETEAKRKLGELYKIVSKELGNTPNVCKKYYVHPAVINLYQSKALAKYFNSASAGNTIKNGLQEEEEMLMKILKAN